MSMNHNIEIINPKLWGIKFSLIPFIEEINYNARASNDIPMYEEPLRIADEGLLILNKEYKLYNLIKPKMVEIMKLKDKKLSKRLALLSGIKNMNSLQIIDMFVLQAEFERRHKERQVNK